MTVDIFLIGLGALAAVGALIFNAVVALRARVAKIRTDSYQQGFESGYAAGLSTTIDTLKSVRKELFAS